MKMSQNGRTGFTRIARPWTEFLAGVLTGLGLLVGGVRDASAAGTAGVQVVRDVSYWHGSDSSPERHRVDLYLPKQAKNCPTIVFVHGGAWMLGDKGFFGWGDAIGTYFASQDVVAVLPSYRLAPKVQNADQARDVAEAVAWTYRHIHRYGGDPERLFLCGHSAGGQLASLVATDPQYLRAACVDSAIVKGVIGVSGVYEVPEVLHINLFGSVFPGDAQARQNASPLSHVRPGLPRFLLVYAQHELPTLDDGARAMAAALKKAGCPVHLLRVANRDHESVMFRARTFDDPVARAILGFVAGPTVSISDLADRLD